MRTLVSASCSAAVSATIVWYGSHSRRSSCARASSGVSAKTVTNSSAPGSPSIVSDSARYSCLERDSSRIVLSIISTAAGCNASAAPVAATASATDSKCPTANMRAFGSGTRPTSASVIATSVPSEPVTSRARLNSRAR